MSATLRETPLLLTPGPLSTHPLVRAAMLRDLGSRDPEFIAASARVRAALEALSPEPGAYAAVPVQGSGTFAVEAMLCTFVPAGGAAAVVVNGVYGARAAELLERAGRRVRRLVVPEALAPSPDALAALLAEDESLRAVFVVHCETTTGQETPLRALAAVTEAAGRALLVDAMSSFGALPLDGLRPLAVAASSNKCLEGVPGLGFVLARREALAAAAGVAHSVSLDLHAQWLRLERDGQFRFTPPTHVLLALDVALRLHAEEGGVAARGARYRENLHRLVLGLRGQGFVTLLPDERQAPIIVTFYAPADPAWSFPLFYEALREQGFAIYPGSLTANPTFRVGCIGQVYPLDIDRFVAVVGEVVRGLGLQQLGPETP